jgi:hypothetical protein
LESCGFDITSVNRYIDTDHLVIIAKNTGRSGFSLTRSDDPKKIIDFFERWDRDTQQFFPQADQNV